MCNTPFCASFVAELPFLQGADFFQPNCIACRGFSCDSRKPAAESSLFAIQSCFPLPLAGKHMFLQCYLQLEVLPISDTWRVHSLGLMRVNTSLPRFPTDFPLYFLSQKNI